MATRPTTARSEISSAISDDGLPSPLPPSSDRARSTTPGAPVSPHGYTHFRGVTNPTNRSFRSPPPASTASGTSRPQSPESTTSRTHVPSLTAQGFLRPMSSSKLHQQRLSNLRASRAARNYPRPQTGQTALSESQEDDDAQSLRSNRTGPYASLPKLHRPATSITTGYTESEPPHDYDATSQQGASEADREYFRGDSPRKKHTPSPLDLNNSSNVVGFNEKALRSPNSFRSGLSIGSRQILPPSNHQHLPSNDTSPRYPNLEEKQYIAKQEAAGKNYEYFEGNNVFWLGGRMQNARDRPINVLTGLFLVVPAILFFVFSYVPRPESDTFADSCSASWTWHHISPAIPIVFAYLFFICFSSFIHGSVTDPGVSS